MRVLLLLILIAVASALGVVYMKHRTRMLFAEFQREQQVVDAYEEELAQLQLEQHTWSERSRIERAARGSLGMAFPARESVISIKP
jgi:cell division protein FtsL